MPLKVYDPASVLVLYNGVRISGFADGTFVNARPNKRDFNLFVGTSGETARALTNDKSGQIDLSLQQSSSSNDVLSAFHAADTLLPRGVGANVMVIKDLNGSTIMLSKSCWITQYPSISFSRDVGTWTWTFETDSIVFSAGGNSSIGA